MGKYENTGIVQKVLHKPKGMRKTVTYFVVGILPILLLTISPMIQKYGVDFYLGSSTITTVLLLLLTSIAWGIALYNIRLGYEILDSLVRRLTHRKIRVRIARIDFAGISSDSECTKLFYLEKEVISFTSKKWVPVRNNQIFFDLYHSDSIAYFADRETAIARMKSLSDGEWKQNKDFDTVTIESEFYV